MNINDDFFKINKNYRSEDNTGFDENKFNKGRYQNYYDIYNSLITQKPNIKEILKKTEYKNIVIDSTHSTELENETIAEILEIIRDDLFYK